MRDSTKTIRKEKRSKRKTISFHVQEIRTNGSAGVFKGIDLSEGGLGIERSSKRAPETAIYKFDFPGSPNSVIVKGHKVYEIVKNGVIVRTGIRFVDLTDLDKERIHAFIVS